MFNKQILIAAVLAATLPAAGSAAAAVVDLRFQEMAGAQTNTQYYGPNVYYDWQNDFHTASFTGDYDFHFTYDTEAGPGYDLTLVSGRVGTYTDFAEWTPSLAFVPGGGLTLQLERQVSLNCCLHYLSGVYFLMQDDDGDIGPTLPTALSIADLDTATASFENRRSGGVGLGYKNVGYARFDGVVEVPQGSGNPPGGGTNPVGGVPEPGAWALMILGFAGAGASLRHRRRLAAAAGAA